jgi:hypothetical protein
MATVVQVKAKNSSCIAGALRGKVGWPLVSKRRRGGKKPKLWIQEAIPPKRRGVLREEVMRRKGRAGFDSRGRIKASVIEEIIRKDGFKKQAVLARTLRKLKRKRGKRREK